MRRAIPWLGVLVLLAGCGAGAASGQVKASFRQFVHAMQRRDVAAACARMSPAFWSALAGEVNGSLAASGGSVSVPGSDCRYLRRGIATRAARILTDAAFTVGGISRVEIHHDKANEASAGIPRKLGFDWLGEALDAPRRDAGVAAGLWLRRRGYGSGCEPRFCTVTVPELSGWVLPGA